METVLNWLWQGTVIAGVLCVMLFALDRARANVRYVVCWAALLAVVALPGLPSIQLADAAVDALRGSQTGTVVSLPDTGWTATLVLLAAWLGWVSLHAIRFIVAIAEIRRARACSVPFPASARVKLAHWDRIGNTRRRAMLVMSESVGAAAVLGWGRPMIAVAPSLVETLDPDELDRILIHEWAHVQRRDDLVNVAQIIVRMIAGWHPAVWWIDRRVHVEREIACDETTVAITGSPKTYAECLVKLAALRSGSTLQGAPAVLTSSGLRARISKIVSAHQSITPLCSRSIAAAIVILVFVMSMGLAGVKLVETTVLALPFVPPPVVSTRAHRVPPAATTRSSEIRTSSASGAASRIANREQPQTQPVPPPSPVESREPVSIVGGRAPESPPAIDASPALPVIPGSVALPKSSPQPDTTAATPRAPWTAVADGGAAIGRKSTDAGVATAGFFSRVARRVARSF
jgi:beta-lactamase regulating signal transducer with metallopeptidase domain